MNSAYLFILLFIMYYARKRSHRVSILLLLLIFYKLSPDIECFVEDYFVPDDPILRELRKQLAVLHPAFENVRIYEGTKSYTINKRRVYICLKDENGRYYPRNALVYVILHEYAHILCDEIDHTEKFFAIFRSLLEKAAGFGLYDKTIPFIKNYCGHT